MKVDDQGTNTVAAQLLRLEEALMDPTVRRDRVRVSALLAADFVEFGSSGQVWMREEILEHLAAEGAYIKPKIDDFSCRLLSKGVALVTYRTIREASETKNCTITLRCSVWTKESEADWQMRFHQGTRTE